MAENGNRGPNDFRSRGARRRREPPIIDASATEVPVAPADAESAGMPLPPDDLPPTVGEAAPEPAEPVLFGSAVREAAPKPEPSPGDADVRPVPEPDEAPLPSSAAGDAGLRAAPEVETASLVPPVDEGGARVTSSAENPAVAPPPGTVPPHMVPSAAGPGGLAPWLLSLAIFALLGALSWVLYTEPRRSGRDAIAALQAKVAALEARADPAPALSGVAALEERVASAEADRGDLTKSVADLTTRLDAVAQDAQGAKDAAQGAKDAAQNAKSEAQGAREQAEKLAATPPAPAETPKPDSAAPAFAPLAALAALSGKVDGIDDRLGSLAADETRTSGALAALPKPVPPDFGPVDARVAALDARLTDLDAKLNGSDARFNGFDAKVNGVDGKINGFDARVNGVDARVNGLETRANDAAAAAGKLQATVAGLPKVDLAPLQASTAALGASSAALDGKIASIEGRLAAAKDGTRVTEARAVGSADEARATPIALVGQSIGRAIAEGRPYGSDLDALKALGAEPVAVAQLSPLAAAGAPTAAALQSRWDAVRGDVLAAVKPAEAGGALDRFAASARALVQVRHVGAVEGDDPAALVSQVDAALAGGDVPAALAAWNGLPQAGRDRSQDWAAAAKGQVDAAGAARGLVARSIATLGRAKD